MENQLITIDNTLYTPTQLAEYLKVVANSEISLLDKKNKINPVITRLQKFKREAKKSFEESIASVTEVESYAKNLKAFVVKAIDEEWESVESRQKRLDILKDKFNLEADTDGNAEMYADDPDLWTDVGNPKGTIKDMIADNQRRENEMLREQLAEAKTDDLASEIIHLTVEDRQAIEGRPFKVEGPIEDDDHTGNLVDEAKFLGARYGAKVTVNPFKKQIVIDY